MNAILQRQSLISFFDKSLNFPFLSSFHHRLPETTEMISLKNLIRNVTKVKNIEKEIAGNDGKKVMLYNKKCKKIENKLNKKCQSH